MNSQPAEWNAETYHQISNPQFSWGMRVLSALDLCGDEVAIDAGCGSGRLTAELLERLPNGRVIAVDRSANMLAEAEAQLRPSFGNRVRFVQADVQLITPAQVGEPVDLVFSTATFHWILDHPRLFRNLFSLLRPGGRLVAQCGGGQNCRRLLDRAAAIMVHEPYASSLRGWSGPWEFADDITTADRLQEAGFVEIETSLLPAAAQMDGNVDFRTFLANVILVEHLARLPKNQHAPFIEQLVELAALDNPPFVLDYWRLNLRGRRPL